jgi:signal transduction histidine kinase
VSRRVLGEGRSWSGRAWVVNAWYLSQYDPIRDPEGRIIGMLYVGSLERQYLDQRTMAVRVQLGLVLGAMLLAMAVLSVLLRATVVSPVQRLRQATQKLSEGDLSYRVEVRSRDELGDLSTSFNRMAAELRANQAEIEESHATLAQRNEELAATNRNYMETLGFVSHELKAPLGSATLGLYSVKDGFLGPLGEEQKRVLGSVGQNLDFLNEMVKHYLNLSRLEKGELNVRKAWIRLKDEVVDPALETLSAALERKAMSIENNLAPGLRVYADRDLLRIVYDNLLSNAVKYGREDGWIRLGADLRSGSIELTVENAGEGIPREQVDRLFRKFSRLTHVEETRQKGTGLGLFICKAIVEQHGGSIGVDSEEGRWTRFALKLPLEGSSKE